MDLRRAIVCVIFVAIGASFALAAEAAAPTADTGHAAKARAKPKIKPIPKAGSMPSTNLSDPSALPTGTAKSLDPVVPADANGTPAEPNGGLSLDLKWHATNDPVDRFDAVRHTSGPNGPGDGVEAGVKIGF